MVPRSGIWSPTFQPYFSASLRPAIAPVRSAMKARRSSGESTNSGYMSRYVCALIANCGKKLLSLMYTPPNQLAHATPVTPDTWRSFCAYVSGSENVSETELRVTSRADELALAPAYHASTMVRSTPNATIATTMPTTVSVVRSLWRNALRSTNRRTNIAKARSVDQHALLQM